MAVSIPWGLAGIVVGWAWRRIEKVLFYKTYLVSHRRWSNQYGLGAYWELLGEDLEYTLRIAQSTDPLPQVSKIAFRARKHVVKCFKGVFEAKGMDVRYQESITIFDVDATPIIYSLVNLPMCEPIDVNQHAIRFSLDTVRFRLCSVEFEDGRLERISDPLTQTLTQTWAQNSQWKENWGSYWNLDAIHFAKQELGIFWRWFGTYSYIGRYSPGGQLSGSAPWWRPMAKIVGWVMSLPWLVTVQFWLVIWSGLFVLDKDDRLSWRRKGSAGDPG